MKSEKAIEIITSVDCGDDIELVQAIETVLQDLQKYKDITTKQDKMIEMMLKYLAYHGVEDDICTAELSKNCDESCKKCIKQYFEKKAEESE